MMRLNDAERRLEPVAVFPDWRGNPYLDELERALRPRGFEFRYPKYRGRLFPFLRAMQRGSYRVLHLHWQHPYIVARNPLRAFGRSLRFLADIAAVRLSGREVVWTVHNLVDHEKTSPRIERMACLLLARLVSRVTALCEPSRSEIAKAYRLGTALEARIEILPHGHFLASYGSLPERSEARRALQIPNDSFVFLTFGAIRPFKRTVEILRAFREVEGTNALLIVAGRCSDPSLKAEIKQEADSDGRVRLDIRFIAPDCVPNYFGAADVFVYAATDVFVSSAVMLALTFGVRSILPRTACFAEIVPDEKVVWCDTDAEKDLREAMQVTLAEEVMTSGDSQVRAEWIPSWEESAERLSQIYAAVLSD